jgi:proteasome alpha subunit
MMNPYDWQEAMSNRVAYIGGRLENGAPVLAISLNVGILIFTYRRQSQKIFEIYDKLAFAGLGQQSDIESIRVMAVEFAHREGYTRSEKDVTIQRVVTSVSAPIKKAFGDFSYAPILANCLFAELGEKPGDDHYYTVEYDGDYHLQRESVVLSGRSYLGPKLTELIPVDATVETAVDKLKDLWLEAAAGNSGEEVSLDGLTPEAVLMERGTHREQVLREVAV